MARPLRLHIPGMLLHVITRGNAGGAMFLDDDDYARYVELLGLTAHRFGVVCESYCLMRTHVHLVLRPGAISISRMMQQLNSRYCQWFNRRHRPRWTGENRQFVDSAKPAISGGRDQ